MITDYRPWVTAVGNDDTNVYSFPFKITKLSEIVVVQIDVSVDPPTIDFVERGDVGLNVQSVDFDSVLGGGTITFTSNLPAGKRIYIKIANDEPTQPSRFRDQQDFKLKSIEDALDFIVNQATRLSDKAERSMRFADPFTHVESVVNLEIQTFPVAYGMPIMSSDAIQLEMKPILLILEEQGVLQLIQDAQDDADNANARLDILEPIVAGFEGDIDELQTDVSDLTARVTTAETDIDTLQAESLDYESRISSLESTVSTHTTQIGNLVTITDDHELRIQDNEADLVDHENRITNLELSGGGGGSGGGSFAFFAPTPGGAGRESKYNRDVFSFDQDGFQTITGVLKRTSAFTSNQKSVTIAWFGDTLNDVVKWTIQSFLVKAGMLVDAGTFSYTEDIDVTVTQAKERIYTTLNFSDASGQIQAQDIDTDDEVFFLIRRDTAVGEIAGSTAYVEQALTQISFT